MQGGGVEDGAGRCRCLHRLHRLRWGRRGGRRAPAGQQGQQGGTRVRFGQVVVHARVQAQFAVAEDGVGRQGNDGRAAAALLAFHAAQAPGRFKTIHFRHLAIHQDHVERGALPQGQRARPVVGRRGFVAAIFQHGQGDFLVDRVVFHQQHAQRRLACGRGVRWSGQGRHGSTRWRQGAVAAGSFDAVAQFHRPHGLGQAVFHAQRRHLAQLGRSVQRTEYDNFQGRHAGVGLDRPHQLGAIHDGHAHVDDGQVERALAAQCALQQVQRLGAVGGAGGGHLPLDRVLQQDAAVGGMVIHDQHVQGVQRHARRRRRRRVLGRHGAHDNGDGEAGTLARHGFQHNVAAHHFHQLLDDGQAQSRAAVFARSGAVGLAKRLEDGRRRFRRHPDARVAHFHADLAGGGAADIDGNLAPFRELGGVIEQVGEDLAQAHGVAAHVLRHVGGDAAGKFDGLALDAVGKQRHHIVDHLAQVEGDMFEHQLARLDLGKVEDVVDDAQQAFAGAVHRVHETLLLGAQFRALQQFRHAQHAIHRRADLVAHLGQEFRLGAVGGVGLGLGLLER
ncbi:hypothetical protein D3C71_796430 [compost metagenome]